MNDGEGECDGDGKEEEHNFTFLGSLIRPHLLTCKVQWVLCPTGYRVA